MYIIYNRDGSIKKVKLTDFINQGSDGVNKIYVSVEGLTHEDYTVSIRWTLPNGDNIGPLVCEGIVEFQDDDLVKYYNGYVVEINEPETLFAGILKGSLVAVKLDTNTLYTYPIKLVVNPTTYVPSEGINISQVTYENLMNYIKTRSYYIIYEWNGENDFTPEELEELRKGTAVIKYNSDIYRLNTLDDNYLVFSNNYFWDAETEINWNSIQINKYGQATLLYTSTIDELVKEYGTVLYDHKIFIEELNCYLHVINDSDRPIQSSELYKAYLGSNFMGNTKVVNMYFESSSFGQVTPAQFFLDGVIGYALIAATIGYINSSSTINKLTAQPTITDVITKI